MKCKEEQRMKGRVWSAEFREELVREYQSSGLNQRGFCAARGISVSGLQRCLKYVSGSHVERKFIELPSMVSTRAKVEVSFSDGTILRVL